MPYPLITARRIPFDIEGCEVGFRSQTSTPDIITIFGNGVASWLDTTSKNNLNKEDRSQTWSAGATTSPVLAFWFFFPEIKEITNLAFQYPASSGSAISDTLIQGSSDSTNGVDGTWETATYSYPALSHDMDNWRKNIFAVSFSGPVKVLRVGIRAGGTGNTAALCGIHIYGQKAAGQSPDDVIFCNSEGVELTSLKDFGDVPEGSTLFNTFYVKNVSEIAHSVNLQLNHADFVMSFDQVNWSAVLDIASLGAGQISAPIYTKLALGPPLLSLGPRAARSILTIGEVA